MTKVWKDFLDGLVKVLYNSISKKLNRRGIGKILKKRYIKKVKIITRKGKVKIYLKEILKIKLYLNKHTPLFLRFVFIIQISFN